jgi:hypothetical protein
MGEWESALARALTGEDVGLAAAEGPDGLLGALERAGWTRAALVAHAEAVWARDQPWPHPDPAAQAAFGAARWLAALGDVRRQLGLDTEARPPSRRTGLDADERRLLQDRPPHWRP